MKKKRELQSCKRRAVLKELEERRIGNAATSFEGVENVSHLVKRAFCVGIGAVSAIADTIAVDNLLDIVRADNSLKIVIVVHLNTSFTVAKKINV